MALLVENRERPKKGSKWFRFSATSTQWAFVFLSLCEYYIKQQHFA
jgi:hypothetical protein